MGGGLSGARSSVPEIPVIGIDGVVITRTRPGEANLLPKGEHLFCQRLNLCGGGLGIHRYCRHRCRLPLGLPTVEILCHQLIIKALFFAGKEKLIRIVRFGRAHRANLFIVLPIFRAHQIKAAYF